MPLAESAGWLLLPLSLFLFCCHFNRARREDGRDIMSDWDGDLLETDTVRTLFTDGPTALPGLPLHRLRKKHRPTITDDDDETPSPQEEPGETTALDHAVASAPSHDTQPLQEESVQSTTDASPPQEEAASPPSPAPSTTRELLSMDRHGRVEQELPEPRSPRMNSSLDSPTQQELQGSPGSPLAPTTTTAPRPRDGPRRSSRLKSHRLPPLRSKSVSWKDARPGSPSPTSRTAPTASPTASARTGMGPLTPGVTDTDGFADPDLKQHGPIGKHTVSEYHDQEHRELSSKEIRPVRLAKIGQRQPRSEHDDDFIRSATDMDFFVLFVANPKKAKSASRTRYDAYQLATTLNEAVTLATTARPKGTTAKQAKATALADIRWDYEHGYILFPGNESLLTGHFIDARQLADDHKMDCQAETVPMAGTVSRGQYGPRANKGAFVSVPTPPELSALRPHAADSSRRLEGADRAEQYHLSDAPIGDKLAKARRTADALKYLENKTEVHAFVSTHLGQQRLFDASTGTYHVEPRNGQEALNGPDKDRWSRADKEELEALLKFGTYELTHLCRGRPMSTKMKVDDVGNVARFKSRPAEPNGRAGTPALLEAATTPVRP